MLKVLVIEDDLGMQELLEETLKRENIEVFRQSSAEYAITAISKLSPDIILLDLGLPGKSGNEFLVELRNHEQFGHIPVIVVTGANSEKQQVEALNLGADDYILKPFLPTALIARIKAVLRRSSKGEIKENGPLVNGKLQVDFSTHKVILDQSEISLTLTEFRILGELVREKGKVLSRDRLRQRALGNLNVTDRTIDVHMASLRKKLLDVSESIQTVRGVGYRFAPAAS